MAGDVALAMLQRDGLWLLQLRDDNPDILFPGHWGCFGGHLEPGETAGEAIRRELAEEIDWIPQQPLHAWFSHHNGRRNVHLFRGDLDVPLQALTLREGQDLRLIPLQQILSGTVWSDVVGDHRPVAPGLQIVLDRLSQEIQ
ncbi:MAG: NUDIX hydrolase [Synechococcus sp.]